MRGRKAFELIVEKTQNMIYGIVYSHVQNRNVAEDLAQDTYVKAFTSLNGLKEPLKVRSWLTSIAHHTAIDWIRKKKEIPSQSTFTYKETNDGRIAEKRELQTLIWQVIKELKPDEIELVVLRYTESLSYKELSSIFNMSEVAVRVKLCRLHQRLEERLKFIKENAYEL